jgi:hypothetical protein
LAIVSRLSLSYSPGTEVAVAGLEPATRGL